MEIVYNLAQIKQAAQQLWQYGSAKKIWAFYAPMGAGKTTLVHALCELLGVTGAVSSPTFAIINEYKSTVAGSIFHMDWYRLKNEDEAIQAGVDDLLYSGNTCFIEWPEKAAALLPPGALQIHIELIDEQTRRLIATL